MSAIPITLFFSLLLAAIFVVLFARDHWRRRFASAERDSLLPLADETPRPADLHAEHDHDHEHDHAGAGCGCRDGSRPPCPGCLRRRDAPTSITP
jgi:ABC-type nickel/cobalt efflux system permease component RcnA